MAKKKSAQKKRSAAAKKKTSQPSATIQGAESDDMEVIDNAIAAQQSGSTATVATTDLEFVPDHQELDESLSNPVVEAPPVADLMVPSDQVSSAVSSQIYQEPKPVQPQSVDEHPHVPDQSIVDDLFSSSDVFAIQSPGLPEPRADAQMAPRDNIFSPVEANTVPDAPNSMPAQESAQLPVHDQAHEISPVINQEPTHEIPASASAIQVQQETQYDSHTTVFETPDVQSVLVDAPVAQIQAEETPVVQAPFFADLLTKRVVDPLVIPDSSVERSIVAEHVQPTEEPAASSVDDLFGQSIPSTQQSNLPWDTPQTQAVHNEPQQAVHTDDLFASTESTGFPWDSAPVNQLDVTEGPKSKFADLDLDDDFIDEPAVSQPQWENGAQAQQEHAVTRNLEEPASHETIPSVPANDENLFGNHFHNDFATLIHSPANEESQVPVQKQKTEEHTPVDKFSALKFDLDDELLEDELFDEPQAAQPALEQATQPTQKSYQPQTRSYQQQTPQQLQQQTPQTSYQPQAPAHFQGYQQASQQQHHSYTPPRGFQSQQPQQQGQEANIDLRKLNANKLKSDAYDFPMDLMPTRHPTKPRAVTAPSVQTPINGLPGPGSAPSMNNTATQTPLVQPAGMNGFVGAPQQGPPVTSQQSGIPPVNPYTNPIHAPASSQGLKKKQSSFFEELPIPSLIAPPRQRRDMSLGISSPNLHNPALHNSGFGVQQSVGQPGVQPYPGMPSSVVQGAQGSPYSNPPPMQQRRTSSMSQGAGLNNAIPGMGVSLPNATHGNAPPGTSSYAQPIQPAPPQGMNQYRPPPGMPQSSAPQQTPEMATAPQYGQPSMVNELPQPILTPKSPKRSNYAPSLNSAPPVPVYVAGPPGMAQRAPPTLTPSIVAPPAMAGQTQGTHPVMTAELNPPPTTPGSRHGSMGSTLMIPSASQGQSQSVISPTAVKYAPIAHRRQLSSSAVQYDPLLAGKAQQKYQAPVLPTLHQRVVTGMAPPQLQEGQQMYGTSVEGGFQQPGQHQMHLTQAQGQFSQAPTISYGQPMAQHLAQPNSTISNPEQLKARQFPLFCWGNGSTIAYSIPKISSYGYGSTLEVVRADKVMEDIMLKQFPSKKNNQTLIKFLDSQISRLDASRATTVDMDELLLTQLIRQKLANPSEHFNLGGVVNYQEQSAKYQDPSLKKSGEPVNKRHMVSLFASGQKDEALQVALSHRDFALALVISGVIGKDRWLSVVESYLSQEFQGDREHFLPVLVKILAGDVDNVIASFKTDEAKKTWACLNWKEISTAVVANKPPSLGPFLSLFGEFLIENGLFVPAYILMMIGDAPLSAFSSCNSLKMTLYVEIYGQYLQDKGAFVDLSSVFLQHAYYLIDYNMLSESQRYCDHAFAVYKNLKKQDAAFLYASKSLNVRLSGVSINDGWFAKPKLEKVWGTLDKGLTKLISGDETQGEAKDTGVFSRFNSDLSRTSSFVSVPNTSAGSEIHPYARTGNSKQTTYPYGPSSGNLTVETPKVQPLSAFAAVPDNLRTYTPGSSTRASVQSLRNTPSTSAHNSAEVRNVPNSDPYSTQSRSDSPRRPSKYAPSIEEPLSRVSSNTSHVSHDELTFRAPQGQFAYPPSQNQPVGLMSPHAPFNAPKGDSVSDFETRFSQHAAIPQSVVASPQMAHPSVSAPTETGPPLAPQHVDDSAVVLPVPPTDIEEPVYNVSIQPVPISLSSDGPTVPSLPAFKLEQDVVTSPYPPAQEQMEVVVQEENICLGDSKETFLKDTVTSTPGESSFTTDTTLQHQDSTLQNSGVIAQDEEQNVVMADTLEESADESTDVQPQNQEFNFIQGVASQTQSEFFSSSATPYQAPQHETSETNISESVNSDTLDNERTPLPVATPPVGATLPPMNAYAPPIPVQSPYAPSSKKKLEPKKSNRFTPKSYTPSNASNETSADTGAVSGDLDFYSISGIQPNQSFAPKPQGDHSCPPQANPTRITPDEILVGHRASRTASEASSGSPAKKYAPVTVTVSQQSRRASYSPVVTPISIPLGGQAPGMPSPIASHMSSAGSNHQNFEPYKQVDDSSPSTMGASVNLPSHASVTEESKFSPHVPNTSESNMSFEPPSARMTAYEPPQMNHILRISEEAEEAENYEDFVEDEDDDDDDDDESTDAISGKMERKSSMKRRDSQSAGGSSRWLGGWFRKENKNEPKVYRANLGEKSTFYYDDSLKRWVNGDADPDELKKQAAPPPPPPIIKKKPSSIMSKPRSDSLLEGGAQFVGGASAPGTPGMSAVPITRGDTPFPPTGAPPLGSDAPPPRKSAPTTSDLDSLIGMSGGGVSTRRKKKPGRGYVDVMSTMNKKQ